MSIASFTIHPAYGPLPSALSFPTAVPPMGDAFNSCLLSAVTVVSYPSDPFSISDLWMIVCHWESDPSNPPILGSVKKSVSLSRKIGVTSPEPGITSRFSGINEQQEGWS